LTSARRTRLASQRQGALGVSPAAGRLDQQAGAVRRPPAGVCGLDRQVGEVLRPGVQRLRLGASQVHEAAIRN
jgi:hypothetical protein